MRLMFHWVLYLATFVFAVFLLETPTGSSVPSDPNKQNAPNAFPSAIRGKVVWSTSRENSMHDIWIMHADGTEKKALTASKKNVDWFPRFSTDGSKVMFVRSVSGWVDESEANIFNKWNIWLIKTDGTEEQKIVDSACWGTWLPDDDSIVYARGSTVLLRCIEGGKEKLLFDAEAVFDTKEVFAQQPELSPNGSFLAVTIRGAHRETGIYNIRTKEWYSTGGGCDMSWFPDNKSVIRVNRGQGNGGTEVLRIAIDNKGKPAEKIAITALKNFRFMDLPGWRSHEYFPKIDKTGKWMVWGATRVGYKHDIADYDIFVWNVATDQETDFMRLTFHSSNDRWPDLFIAE